MLNCHISNISHLHTFNTYMYLVLDLANMENGGRALLQRSEEMLPDDLETGDHTTLAVLSSKDFQRSRSVVVMKFLLNAALSECVVLYFSVLTEGIIHIHRNAGSKLIAMTVIKIKKSLNRKDHQSVCDDK